MHAEEAGFGIRKPGRNLCTASVSHGSQGSPAREAGFPAAAKGPLLSASLLRPAAAGSNLPSPYREGGLWQLSTLSCTLSREESRPLGAGLSFPFVSPLSGSHLSAVPLTQLLAALRKTLRPEVVAADPAPPHPAPRRPRRHPGFPCPPLVRHPCLLLSPWWAWIQRGAIPALGTAGWPFFCKQRMSGCGGTCL